MLAVATANTLAAQSAPAGDVPTPTPVGNPCDTVTLPGGNGPIIVGEGNVDRCIEVDAPDECCWTTVVDGYAELISPVVQCGNHTACYHVFNCDCSGCRFPFEVDIADQRFSGECVNFTPPIPTATAFIETPTPTPDKAPCDHVDLPNGTGTIFVGEGNVDRCIEVDAPDECCWTTAVSGHAERISPEVQCGDQSACIHVFNCDCSGCRFPFEVKIADQQVMGECVNYTPTSTSTAAEETPTVTPTAEPSATSTSSAMDTPTPEVGCVGDCNNDTFVYVDEVITLVNIVLGTRPPESCPTLGSVEVTVAEVVTAVNHALDGC